MFFLANSTCMFTDHKLGTHRCKLIKVDRQAQFFTRPSNATWHAQEMVIVIINTMLFVETCRSLLLLLLKAFYLQQCHFM